MDEHHGVDRAEYRPAAPASMATWIMARSGRPSSCSLPLTTNRSVGRSRPSTRPPPGRHADELGRLTQRISESVLASQPGQAGDGKRTGARRSRGSPRRNHGSDRAWPGRRRTVTRSPSRFHHPNSPGSTADSVVERVHRIPPYLAAAPREGDHGRRAGWSGPPHGDEPSPVPRRHDQGRRYRCHRSSSPPVAAARHPRRRPPQRLRRQPPPRPPLSPHDSRHPAPRRPASECEDRHPGRSHPGHRPAQLERPIDPEGLPPHQRVASDLGRHQADRPPNSPQVCPRSARTA